MCDTAFWRGMAAGMAAGAIIGMTVAEKRKAMKTCVGRTMQQMGTAVDGALSDLMHRLNRRESARKGGSCAPALSLLTYMQRRI